MTRRLHPSSKAKAIVQRSLVAKPGVLSEPASGFIFAYRVPKGNPSDPSYVLPMLDKVQHAIDRIASANRFRVHSLGGDLGVNDTAVAPSAT